MVTDVSLHPVLDIFRKHSAGIVAVFFHPQSSDSTSVTPGPKAEQKPGNLNEQANTFQLDGKFVTITKFVTDD
jgi:hypothetical protein